MVHDVERCRRAGYGRCGSSAFLVVLMVVLLGPVVLPPPAVAADTVTFVARIDGRPISQASEARPVRVTPERPLLLELEVTNTGTSPVQVRTVRLAGSVMGLPFFGYQTSVGISLPPGSTVNRQFSLDVAGLGGQATGLMPSSIALLDEDHNEVASEALVVDVRGSLRSVYGLFGLAVAALAALSLTGALLALARHRLPSNRWQRGMRFLAPGIGLGLTLVFALSALRILVPRPGRWVPILIMGAAALFVVGYLSPTPDAGEPEPDELLEGADAGTSGRDGRA